MSDTESSEVTRSDKTSLGGSQDTDKISLVLYFWDQHYLDEDIF